jgi:glycosyltransferase involved in cell wall biosynthesis
MRILHIIDSLSMGGAENLLIGLSSGQQNLGHDVTVKPLICAQHTPVRDKMESCGVKVSPFAEKGSVYNPLFIFKIMKELKKYDIVHVHLFPALYWAGFAKFFSLKKTPLVYTEHSTKNKRRNNKFLHAVDRIVYQYGYKMIIACADKALETYVASYPTIKHVCAINNGVDTRIYKDATPYSKQELLGESEDTFIVTMVARFMTMKRQDTVVEALAILPSNIHAVFVGGEANDEGLVRVKQIVTEKGVSDRVHFLYIRKDVPRILRTSDVVIMASDYEGLSLSSIEGMAAEKPFVATNVNGLKEVVGGAGVLFENNDSESLAKILNRLSSDKDYYETIAKRCSERAKKYDIRKMVDSYIEIYKNINYGR